MKFRVRDIEKYGRKVWQHIEMDELRESQCLCLNCALLHDCEIAKKAFELCQVYGVAFAMTRCPNFICSKPELRDENIFKPDPKQLKIFW